MQQIRTFTDQAGLSGGNLQDLIKSLKAYIPFNEQEENDKRVMLHLLETQDDILTRENQTAHFSASSWLLNKEHTKALMVYHNLYNSWSWTGGHADGRADLLAVAAEEAMEETGIRSVRSVSDEIFSIEILTVDGHIKRGEYVPSHLHLNVTYLLEADEQEQLCVKPDENSGVKWFSLEAVSEACTEPWMVKWVYTKMIKRTKNIFGF